MPTSLAILTITDTYPVVFEISLPALVLLFLVTDYLVKGLLQWWMEIVELSRDFKLSSCLPLIL